MSGRIKALWSKRAHRGPMDSLREATLIPGQGLEGSVGRSTRRQVTVLASEAWVSAVAGLAKDPGPASRRANIMISGVELANTRGRVLRLGACRIAVGGEVRPCERMDEAAPGLRAALSADWRGGVFGQVLTGGIIRIGDLVEWEPTPDDDR